MKLFLIILFILFVKKGASQNILIGCYSRLDSKICINSDSSFKFYYSVDTYRSWSKGIWTLKDRKIALKIIPVYDTLVILKDSSMSKDSLILSRDEKSERITNDKNKREFYIWTVEQNEGLCTNKLFYKKGKLFVVKHGKLQKKKIDNGFYIKPFAPWYVKTRE